MKLCSRLLMVFSRNFCEKRQIWVSEPHLGKLGVTHHGDARPWLMTHWKAHGQLSIHLNWSFLAIYYGSGVMMLNVYSSVVFAGDRPLCTQILPGQGRSSATILGTRKLGTLGYPVVTTASLCVAWFWRTDGRADRRTDRQTDMP